MTQTIERTIPQSVIDGLSLDERLELMADIWNSLDEIVVAVTEEQRAEIDRRLATFHTDKFSAIPWEVAREEILKDLK